MAQAEFDFTKNYHRSDPVTSKKAASRVKYFANAHHGVIFYVLLKHGGLTSEEISFKCDLDRHQVARRLPEMEQIGTVKKTGHTRRSTKGRQGVVWEVNQCSMK